MALQIQGAQILGKVLGWGERGVAKLTPMAEKEAALFAEKYAGKFASNSGLRNKLIGTANRKNIALVEKDISELESKVAKGAEAAKSLDKEALQKQIAASEKKMAALKKLIERTGKKGPIGKGLNAVSQKDLQQILEKELENYKSLLSKLSGNTLKADLEALTNLKRFRAGMKDTSLLGNMKRNPTKWAVGIGGGLGFAMGDQNKVNDDAQKAYDKYIALGGTPEQFYFDMAADPKAAALIGISTPADLYHLTGLTHADILKNQLDQLKDQYSKPEYYGSGYDMSHLVRHTDENGNYYYTTADGTRVTGSDGRLTQDAWTYLASLNGKDFANRTSANMLHGNVYLNGLWRLDYADSGNKTADWNTAYNSMSDEEKALFSDNGIYNVNRASDTSHVIDPLTGKMVDMSKFDYDKVKDDELYQYDNRNSLERFVNDKIGLKGRLGSTVAGGLVGLWPVSLIGFGNDAKRNFLHGDKLKGIGNAGLALTLGGGRLLGSASKLAGTTTKLGQGLEKGSQMAHNWKVGVGSMGAMLGGAFTGHDDLYANVGTQISEEDPTYQYVDLSDLGKYRFGGRLTVGKYYGRQNR